MILVTGATGLVGGEVVRRLSGQGVPVRALVRNREKAARLGTLPKVDIAEGDMAKPETLAAPLDGIDRAFLVSSSDPAMLDVQSSFVDAARKAGVRHVVKLSGIMPEVDSPFRFARMHGLIEKHIEASGLAYTHLRAGEFMHSYFRAVPTIVAKQTLFLPMEEARIASIDVGDLAEIATLCLTDPGHEGKIYPLTGAESLTMAEAAEKLSAATGKTIRYVNVPPEVARQNQLAAGFPPYLADALFELFAERRRGKEETVHDTCERVFGLTPLLFDEFAARHAAVFRGEQPAPSAL